MHFELFDFSYQVLNVAEVEAGLLGQSHKNPHVAQVLKFMSTLEEVFLIHS